jgi:hypothetical protein
LLCHTFCIKLSKGSPGSPGRTLHQPTNPCFATFIARSFKGVSGHALHRAKIPCFATFIEKLLEALQGSLSWLCSNQQILALQHLLQKAFEGSPGFQARPSGLNLLKIPCFFTINAKNEYSVKRAFKGFSRVFRRTAKKVFIYVFPEKDARPQSQFQPTFMCV